MDLTQEAEEMSSMCKAPVLSQELLTPSTTPWSPDTRCGSQQKEEKKENRGGGKREGVEATL